MSELEHAYVQTVLALAAWRAARDVEAYVAHLVTAGQASITDLASYRASTRERQRAHGRTRQRYLALAGTRSVRG